MSNIIADVIEPHENWRIEVVEDSRNVAALIEISKKGLLGEPAMRRILDQAIANAEAYFEGSDFILFEDGSLREGIRIYGKPIHVLQIDLTEAFNTTSLMGLHRQIILRQTRRRTYPAWSVSGHLKGGSTYIDDLMLADNGTFYLRNQRQKYETERHILLNPLPVAKKPVRASL